LEGLCRRLLKYDQDIIEIVQFDSSVYAPEYSRDIDLLVITEKAKESNGYFDIVNPGDAPVNVDIIVLSVNEKPREGLLRGVLGAFKMLYGSGEYLLKSTLVSGSRGSLRILDKAYNTSSSSETPVFSDSSFNLLSPLR